MKQKHLEIRVAQCLLLAEASNCPRRKFGAMILDPERNVVLVDSYNGGPRGGGRLCGGDVCLRDKQCVPSGTHMEIGCHHAELNAVCNAAANGIKIAGAMLIVTGEPCGMCAKYLHHAGIREVVVVQGGYAGENGIGYLQENGVAVTYMEGPKDTRAPQSKIHDTP